MPPTGRSGNRLGGGIATDRSLTHRHAGGCFAVGERAVLAHGAPIRLAIHPLLDALVNSGSI